MGSLFKLRDFWATKCGDEEEFDKKSMVVANIDNESSPQDKIILGSFSGVLRIYQPRQKGFKPDDLLLEQQLDAPILQLGVGRFLPNMQQLALAVLHPRKLIVYSVVRQGGAASAGDGSADPLARQFGIKREYEHNMDRTAYNFCTGPFGGVYGKDYICVQSMDGQLQFFEQDKLVFSRFLHNFVVPGHLCYNPKTDCFITNTSTLDIECYKYQVLHTSSGSEEKQEKSTASDGQSTGTGGKKIQVDWSLNVGEDVVDIRVAKFSRGSSNNQPDIIVLGERTVFIIKEQGQIRQQKRLDYFASCLTPYLYSGDSKVQNVMIGTYNNSIQIYNDVSLIWAAKTPSVPLAMEVSSMCKVDGMIVMLTADGQLSINYLGTDPASTPVQNLESKELDYEDMDEEHRRLQALIRQAVNAGKAEPKEQIQVKAQVPPTLDSPQDGTFDSPASQHHRSTTVKLFLSYSGDEDIENAVLTVNVPSPFQLDEQSILILSLHGSGGRDPQTPMVVHLTIYLPDVTPTGNSIGLLPTSLQTTCLVAYTNPNGEPLTTKTTFLLPLALAGCVIPPVKNPQFKITLDTNRVPPQMQQLFDDIVAGKGELASAGNVLSFQYYNTNGCDVTILVSKNAGRYRIQSGTFEALWLFTSELARRLKLFYVEGEGAGSEENAEPFCISYSENLPFQEYFNSIDVHFKARQSLTGSQQVLSERAHQFRSIQKRLLVRFKDRNPSPLCNLDLLFEDTYRNLINVSETVETNQALLQGSANSLTCATHLMLFLIRYRFQLKKEDFKVLSHCLSPVVVDSQTQGWEECTDAAMTHLLRTCLAKNPRESGSLPQPLAVPNDINKLKKHIALVCDRLAKGGTLRMDTNKPKHRG
uniref:PTHB1 N-terminal domain-containing protein n=2 Tax=Eutreptiella gymnastica TaxID=73025 RepID=A0A7S1IUQ3_9EUGL|mmetsp:Transcript_43109/g.77459  ORF Transcript_43109/g.77459 Transcript_43109/m.77459 type:complete len:869 (+) Transcript_43109:65-2671(+)